MASTRQAVSMDYDDVDRAKLRREGPCIRRDPSPFSACRPGMFNASLRHYLIYQEKNFYIFLLNAQKESKPFFLWAS